MPLAVGLKYQGTRPIGQRCVLSVLRYVMLVVAVLAAFFVAVLVAAVVVAAVALAVVVVVVYYLPGRFSAHK